MSVTDLAFLEEVDVRLAWPHEAQDFTPWLTQHLDRLAMQVGIPMELEGSEVKVDVFAADILARNPQDNSLILIENQLTNSDHNHLGQIMTYLAGLEAKVVIWVAKEFQEAHLSAVKWLNEHTNDTFSFFAVKVRVVKISHSPLAPIFEVVARPNQWERKLQVVANENNVWPQLMQFRQAFWEHYINRYPKIAFDAMSGVNSNRWREVASLGVVISSYVAKSGVGVFVRSKSSSADAAAAVYQTLLPFAEELGQQLDAQLGNPDGKYFFSTEYKANTSDRSRWDELVNWLYEKTETYENALQALGE